MWSPTLTCVSRGIAISVLVALVAPSIVAAQAGATAPLVQGEVSLVPVDDARIPPGIASVVRETQAAMMLTAALFPDGDGTAPRLSEPTTLGDRWELCAGESFALEPTYALCGATLIGPDRILTAEHCVPDSRNCDALSFVFGYELGAGNTVADPSSENVYACAEILTSAGTGDYALIRLDREVVGRTPAPIRYRDPQTCEEVTVEERVFAAGFPAGTPLKVDLGDPLMDPGSGVEVTDSSVSGGRFFRAGFDLYAGSDGAGVFDAEGLLVGFLSTGRRDYIRQDEGCYASNIVDDAGREQAGHVNFALSAYCRSRASRDDTQLCPEEVLRCGADGVSDAGVAPYPRSNGCGCSVRPTAPPLGGLVGLVLVGLARWRRRRSLPRN